MAVTSGDLHDEVTATATVVQAETQTVSLPLADGRSVVTRGLVTPGQQLCAGQVLLHVNGRPLIALPGAFPSYRDLVQGNQGDDVVQLQQALVSLGYSMRADGEFGAVTARALADLYKGLGYSASTISSSQAGGSRAAGSGVDITEEAPASASDGQEGRKRPQAGAGSQAAVLTLPQSEVVYVPGLESCPVVAELPAEGQVLDAATAVMTVASGSARVEAQMPKTVADTLSAGARARAVTAAGEVSLTLDHTRLVEQDPATAGETGGQQTGAGAGIGAMGGYLGSVQAIAVFTVEGGGNLPAPGEELVLTIERSPTITGALLVPKRAVATASDESHSVLVRQGDGSFLTVPVTLQSCVGGQCAISADSLSVGDLLRIDQS